MRRRWAGPLVTLLTLVVLAAVIAQVDATAARRALTSAPPGVLIGGALGALIMAIPLSSACLQWSLRGFGHRISSATALRATVGTLSINGVLPVGGGELGRVAWLHRTADVPLAPALAAAIVIRVFKLVFLLGAATVALWAMPGSNGALVLPVTGALVAAVAGVLASPWLLRALAGSGPKRVRAVAASLLEGGTGLSAGPLAVGALFAFLVVAAEWVLFAFVLHGVGGPWDPGQVLGAFSIATIASKLPVTAMGLGTREAAVLALFEGVDPPRLLAATLLHSLLAHLLPTLVGAVGVRAFLRDVIEGPEAPEA